MRLCEGRPHSVTDADVDKMVSRLTRTSPQGESEDGGFSVANRIAIDPAGASDEDVRPQRHLETLLTLTHSHSRTHTHALTLTLTHSHSRTRHDRTTCDAARVRKASLICIVCLPTPGVWLIP